MTPDAVSIPMLHEMRYVLNDPTLRFYYRHEYDETSTDLL